MREFLNHPLAKVFAIISVLAGGIVFTTWLMRPRPREGNRVLSFGGYSVIHPDDWSSNSRLGGKGLPEAGPVRDFIELSPDRYLGIAPSMHVFRLAGQPDQDALRKIQFTDGQFQEEKALVRVQKLKRAVIRDAIFERAGQWFDVGERLPTVEQMRADEWWKFLETFRYPDPNAPALPKVSATTSTAPSTVPLSLPDD